MTILEVIKQIANAISRSEQQDDPKYYILIPGICKRPLQGWYVAGEAALLFQKPVKNRRGQHFPHAFLLYLKNVSWLVYWKAAGAHLAFAQATFRAEHGEAVLVSTNSEMICHQAVTSRQEGFGLRSLCCGHGLCSGHGVRFQLVDELIPQLSLKQQAGSTNMRNKATGEATVKQQLCYSNLLWECQALPCF